MNRRDDGGSDRMRGGRDDWQRNGGGSGRGRGVDGHDELRGGVNRYDAGPERVWAPRGTGERDAYPGGAGGRPDHAWDARGQQGHEQYHHDPRGVTRSGWNEDGSYGQVGGAPDPVSVRSSRSFICVQRPLLI